MTTLKIALIVLTIALMSALFMVLAAIAYQIFTGKYQPTRGASNAINQNPKA